LRVAANTDWVEWHDSYDDPDSNLSRRLRVVQGQISDWLDRTSPRDVRVVSACAGDGRDLIDVLAARGDSPRVVAALLESDDRNADRADASIARAGLGGITVRRCDAGRMESYAGAVPADLVLLCGVFGNISDGDIRRTVEAVPQLCAPGGTVVWTRHRRSPDLTPDIRRWFQEAGLEEVSFVGPDDASFSVGVNRLTAPPQPLDPDGRLFTFMR
jgi:hypothetical protein